MTSFTELVDEVLLAVEGYSTGHSTIATVAAPAGAPDTSITVTSGVRFSPGLVEVGDELVYATGFDTATSTLTGCIRGYRGTTASAHSAGVVVKSQPKFPRAQVKRFINDTINSLFPKIGQVAVDEFTLNTLVPRYELPAGVTQVLGVYAQSTTVDVWVPVTRWTLDRNAPEASGAALQIGDGFNGGQVRVLYVKPATELADGDDFTDTGLPVYARELLVFGAAWRLMSFTESGRVAVTTASQTALNGVTAQPGQGTNLSKYFLGMFMQSLDAAEKRFRVEHPAVRHYGA